MNRAVRHLSVGVFIASGLALLAAIVLTLGVRGGFRRHATLIAYFDQSVNGLHEGAAVKWQGVTVGSVADIQIHHDQAPDDFSKPVFLRMDLEALRRKVDDHSDVTTRRFLEAWIRQGLRARLESESFVSGKLFVELAMVSDDPSPRWHQLRPELMEIPTVPSEIQRLLANFGRMNFSEISRRSSNALRELEKDRSELNLQELARRLAGTRDLLNRALESSDLGALQAELRGALQDTRRLAEHLDARLSPLSREATDLLSQAQNQLAGATRLLSSGVGPHGAAADLRPVLDDLNAAHEALGRLMETLRRNPSVILTGNAPRPSPPTPSPSQAKDAVDPR